MIFAICKRLRWSDNNTFTCVNTKWVEIFHITYSNTVIIAVANNLIFYFFPAFQTFLYQNLWRKRESFFTNNVQFLLVISKSRSKTSKCISCTHNHRIAQIRGSLTCLFDILTSFTLYCLDINLFKLINKQFTVFSIHNSSYRSTKNADIVFFQYARAVQLHTTIKRSLSTK